MLEQELLDGLRPVAAPGDLWDRMTLPGRRVYGRSGTCPTWLLAAAAAVVVIAVGWSFRPPADSRASVRDWVKTNAGMDLPFADRAGVHVLAAHVSRNAANVGFTVDGREGRLLMMKTDVRSGGVPHVLPASDARVYSWASGGLAFTLECTSPEDLRAACSLCHG